MTTLNDSFKYATRYNFYLYFNQISLHIHIMAYKTQGQYFLLFLKVYLQMPNTISD